MFDEPLLPVEVNAGSYAGKTLRERATGRFYTHDVLATDLAARLTEALIGRSQYRHVRALSVCDPFCGDGRLIVALLMTIADTSALRRCRVTVTLRDIDSQAVKVAGRNVIAAAQELDLDVVLREEIGDSFAIEHPPVYDIVITNPPWELLKPDTREMAHLSPAKSAAYRNWLKARCAQLDARFPDAKADVAWAGWGTNLARCGWDLALRSCRPGGAVGIVLPATILADQASASMRRAALSRAKLVDLVTYPSEARLFAKVDQPVVAATFVAEAGGVVDATLRLYGADRLEKATRHLSLSPKELDAVGYALPVGFGAEAAGLLGLFSNFPQFCDLEGNGPSDLWAGRELDGTGLHAKLRVTGQSPFISGRMVRRHEIAEWPSQFVPPDLASRFRSVAFERLVWRDVTRSSQRRRMIGTIIPTGWVTSNSLHVAYFRDGDRKRLCALHGVLSSFVFEFQIRSRLATGHMSLGIVRAARVPKIGKMLVKKIAPIVERVLATQSPEAQATLETKVAQAYGIDRDGFAAILAQFPKVDASERAMLLDCSLWK